MTRPISLYALAFALPLAALPVAASLAGTVTVDTTAQTAKSEDASLEAKWVKPRGEQFGVVVQNTTMAPRDVTISFTGLKDEKYDVYVNTGFYGSRSAKELQSGLAFTVDGTIADPDMMRCLNATKPIVDAEFIRLSKSKEPEPARVAATLSQAAEWVRSGIKSEKAFRSIAVIVTPAGRVLEKMSYPTRMNDLETARAITRACWLLQQARARMSNVIHDPDLRDTAVAAMTPVELAPTYSVKNGKPHIEAKLTNNCNLPISGKITALIPPGWKSTAKNTSFTDLKCGKTYKLGFDLVPTTRNAPPPDSIKLAATIKLVQNEFEANYHIRSLVKRGP